jgi:hypothetical protein
VTWEYGDMPPDEVEVRLTSIDEGATLLELEHATTSDTAPDGSVDALIGVGVGWELAMDYLRRYLVGTLPVPEGPARQQDFQPTAEDRGLLEASGRAWTELLRREPRTE